jgi:hypothetical protein
LGGRGGEGRGGEGRGGGGGVRTLDKKSRKYMSKNIGYNFSNNQFNYNIRYIIM